ncbi:MAG: hypothetical protein CME40_00520 [Haliea sp.]|nr:hypothetical protein [Haliea sp.]
MLYSVDIVFKNNNNFNLIFRIQDIKSLRLILTWPELHLQPFKICHRNVKCFSQMWDVFTIVGYSMSDILMTKLGQILPVFSPFLFVKFPGTKNNFAHLITYFPRMFR